MQQASVRKKVTKKITREISRKGNKFGAGSPSAAAYDESLKLLIESTWNEYKIRKNIGRVIETIEDKIRGEDKKIYAFVELGKRLMKERIFKHANNLLTEGVEKHRNSSLVAVEMGKLKHITRMYEESNKYFQKALDIGDANEIEIFYNMGVNYFSMENYDKALVVFDRALQLNPKYAECLCNMALCHKRNGQPEKALKLFNEAILLSPTDPELHNNIGTLHYSEKRYEDAILNYLKALEIKKDDVEILSNLGNALVKLENYSDAWLAFDEALKIKADSYKIIENYLLCTLEAKDMKKFDFLMKQAGKILPTEAQKKMKTISVEYKNAMGIFMSPTKRGTGLMRKFSRQSGYIRKKSLVGEVLLKKKSQMGAESKFKAPQLDDVILEENEEEK